MKKILEKFRTSQIKTPAWVLKTVTAVMAGLFIGLLLVSVVFLTKHFAHGRISASVFAANVSLAFETPETALKKLQREVDGYLDKGIKITIDQSTKELTPRELGIKMSAQDLIDKVEVVNLNKQGVAEVFFPDEEKRLTLSAEIDESKMEESINAAFGLNDIGPTPANFFFDQNGNLSIQEGTPGFYVNREKLKTVLKVGSESLEAKDIKIALEYGGPELNAEKLEQTRPRIQEALAHRFTLVDPVYTGDWTESLNQHKDWVSFVPNKNSISIEIKPAKLNEYIDAEISEWLDLEATPVNIYTDEDGEPIIEGMGHDGLKIKRAQLKKDIETAVANLEESIEVPVETITPEITISEDLQELGITDRISVGHTSYYGSRVNRVHNIKVGAEKFNGALIAPGEVFSFNKTLGPVDGSHGYRKELVIKSIGTVPDWGGGICQVSTTFYRTLVLGGFTPAERHPHSYPVSYYSQILGHGLDATIFLGGPDLKFENETNGHILVQTYTKSDYELYFVFYGSPTEVESVEMEGPYISNHRSPGPTKYIDTTDLPPGETKQVEVPHIGYDVLWYRHTTMKNGEVVTEPIKTSYKAIPAKIWVGIEPGE